MALPIYGSPWSQKQQEMYQSEALFKPELESATLTTAEKGEQARIKYFMTYGDKAFRERYMTKGSPYYDRTVTTYPQIPTISSLYGSGYEIPERPPSTSYDIPPLELPDIYTPGELEIPGYDYGKVSSLAQQYAAPEVKNLRTAYQTIAQESRYGENPNVRRMTIRDALAGVGEGLSAIQAQSMQTAASQYAAEYAPLVEGAMSEWTAGNVAKQQEYVTAVSTATKEWMEANKRAENLWKQDERWGEKVWDATLAQSQKAYDQFWNAFGQLIGIT